VDESWTGKTCSDLHYEYENIFATYNRNAASHLWSWFLLERSEQMTDEKFVEMFTCFCAVSGSPTRPSEFNRYKLILPKADGSGAMPGFMHYCCWPCVCDTQDFMKVDTKTIKTKDGERSYYFTVLGNPCQRPEELTKKFEDPFSGSDVSLAMEAPELKCDADGALHKAPLSDNGYVIIGMVFDYPEGEDPEWDFEKPEPGRVIQKGGVKYQDEGEYSEMCHERAERGYDSGMGEIFRKVAAISPIQASENLQ
jgi:hypothetical protein